MCQGRDKLLSTSVGCGLKCICLFVPMLVARLTIVTQTLSAEIKQVYYQSVRPFLVELGTVCVFDNILPYISHADLSTHLFCVIIYTEMSSQIRQNFHQDCEAAINRQINLELYASYVYLSMVRKFFQCQQCNVHLFSSVLIGQCSLCLRDKKKERFSLLCFCFQAYYFDRDDKSLSNFAKFFHAQSKQECEHAEKLMSLQNKRGGRMFLQDIRVCTHTFHTQLIKLVY